MSNDSIIAANDVPFKEMEFSPEERKAISSLRAAILSAISSPSSTSPSSPFYPFLASSPPRHTHWWSLFATVIQQRRLQRRAEIVEMLEGNKKLFNGDDSKLRAEEYDVNKKLSDFDLLRFLRARKMHEGDALKMILQFIKWRYDIGVASLNLLPDMPFRDFLMAVAPHMWHGVAKDGSPVYLNAVGEIDAHAFTTITSKEMLQISHAWDMESVVRRLYRHSVESGRRIQQLIFLMDFDGVSLAHAKCASAFKVTAEMDQNCYPELLHSMIFVNAPSFFPVLWSLCKGFLDKKTQSKMHVFSTGNRGKLLEMIDADQLPVEFGGSGRCSCKKIGGGRFCVPRKGNLGFWEFTVKKPNAEEGLEIEDSMADWKKITVKARRKFEITFSLMPEDKDEKEDSQGHVKLEWEYEVKHKDVQFSAEFISDYAQNGQDQTELSPVDREKSPSVSAEEDESKSDAEDDKGGAQSTTTVDAPAVSLSDKSVNALPDHVVIHAAQRMKGKHKGQFLLPMRAFGTIRFVFSNEYSRWNSKEVQFKITKQTVLAS